MYDFKVSLLDVQCSCIYCIDKFYVNYLVKFNHKILTLKVGQFKQIDGINYVN